MTGFMPFVRLDGSALQALVGGLGAGAYAVDLTGVIRACNAEAERLLGHPPGALLGHDAHQVLHRTDRRGRHEPAADCNLLAVLSSDRPAQTDDDIFVRADGSLVPVGWLAVPVREGGVLTGAAVLFYEATEATTPTGPASVRDVAAMATRRLFLLSEVSHALASTGSVDEALHRLAGVVVPAVADSCVVDQLGEDGSVHRVAVVHREPKVDATGFEGSQPPLAEDESSSLPRVLRGEGAVLLEEVLPPDSTMSDLACKHHALLAELGATSAVVAPLRARRHVVGAVTLVRNDPKDPFTSQDLVFADELGRRAGMLLENARTVWEQRRAVETLQRSLLTTPPSLDRLEIEVRYLPANEAAQIGGDWYDGFLLPDGSLGLVIGDVAGHDIEAAARMAQLRSFLRGTAYAFGDSPGPALNRVDRVMQGLNIAELATAIYLQIWQEGARHRLRWSNAGHPPPLLLDPSGKAEELGAAAGILLGVATGAEERPEETREFEPGSTLVLFTDGLVEHRGERLEAGLARLRQAATALAAEPLPAFCDDLLRRLVGAGTTDDVALLAVRLHPAGDASR